MCDIEILSNQPTTQIAMARDAIVNEPTHTEKYLRKIPENIAMKRHVAITIGILAILIVFLLPFGIHIDLGPGPNSIISMIWEIPLSPAWYSLRFFSAFMYYFEFCFFRLFFLLDVFLLLIGKYNRTRFLAIGIISEVIPLALSIRGMSVLNSQGENIYPIIFPIPFLTVFDIILILSAKRLRIL